MAARYLRKAGSEQQQGAQGIQHVPAAWDAAGQWHVWRWRMRHSAPGHRNGNIRGMCSLPPQPYDDP